MSVKFNVNQRVNPRDLNAPHKFYPTVKSSGDIDLDKISARISSMCTVTAPDVYAVLIALVQVMKEEIAEGNIVQLGQLGTFRLFIKGQGSELEKDVRSSSVIRARLRFRPSPQLESMLKTLKFEKAETPTLPADRRTE